MKFLELLNKRNKLLAYLGTFFLLFTVVLSINAIVNPKQILGINSMIKPIKFALSTWIYGWTLAYLLYYVNNQNKVKWFSILAVVTMVYENSVITIQAFRGKLSHFNQTEIVGGILYSIMGIMIVWVSSATLVLAIRFIRQKTYTISQPFALSIKIGLILFVLFSFFGGYMSAINSHNVGGEIGKAGLPLINWSTLFGDLRVAHFFGIHSLQLIPLMGYYFSKNISDQAKASKLIWIVAIVYFSFVCFTAFQAIQGLPFIKI